MSRRTAATGRAKARGAPTVLSDKVTLPDSGVLLMAAGFEDRSTAILTRLRPISPSSAVILVRYQSDIPANLTRARDARRALRTLGPRSQMAELELDSATPEKFERDLIELVKSTPLPTNGELWLDISGFTMLAICVSLRALRRTWPLRPVRLIYTEADKYFPLEREYREIVQKPAVQVETEELPEALTSEVDRVVLPESFRGFTTRDLPTCLILMAGYERHRSAALIDYTNPSRLVLVYGVPDRQDLKSRVKLAKVLHKSFASQRETAEEMQATTDVLGTRGMLLTYYEMLYDNHNICIAPISGKLHTVSTYLTWEQYSDIQLLFTIPVTYLPERFTAGVGQSFTMVLPPPPGAELFDASGAAPGGR